MLIRVTILIQLLLFLQAVTLAQQKITGVVRGKDSAVISNATVSVSNSRVATLTDENGYFSITAKPSDKLIISSLGFITKELKVESQSNINIFVSPSFVN